MDEGKNVTKKEIACTERLKQASKHSPLSPWKHGRGGDTARSVGSKEGEDEGGDGSWRADGTLTKRGGFSHSGTERANQEAAPQRRAGSKKHMRREHTHTHTST